MDVNPASVARAIGARTQVPEKAGRTRGDVLTVDPEDRKRRATAALLELVVDRAASRP